MSGLLKANWIDQRSAILVAGDTIFISGGIIFVMTKKILLNKSQAAAIGMSAAQIPGLLYKPATA